MSSNYERAFEFLNHANEIMGSGYEDQMSRMEEEYNATIDECVAYGSFDAERGEELKAIHHQLLWKRLGRLVTSEEEE